MEAQQQQTAARPRVHCILPDQSLSYEHHGPPTTTLSLDSKPRYFQNPWKSWRRPTLADAWTAYQKGAAIALPLHASHTAHSRKSRVTYNDGTIAGQLEDDSEDNDNDTTNGDDSEDYGLLEGDPRGIDGSIRSIKFTPVPKIVYIRPELSSARSQDDLRHWKDQPIDVVAPRWEAHDKVDVTWLGHASVFARIPWSRMDIVGPPANACGVLFDPIFSYRCSPSQYIGPARYLNPPCSVAELPPVHMCCISHDHCGPLLIHLLGAQLTADDHLDYNTIMDLLKYHEDTIHFFVPLGLEQWFTSCGVPADKVTELDWWHEVILSYPSTSSPSNLPSNALDPEAALNLKLACTPAQHRSGRGVSDHMKALWASWTLGVVSTEDFAKVEQRGMRGWNSFKLFFGGDTGYRYATAPDDDPDAICPAFKEISHIYGPISLAFLPLSTGSSLPFLRTILSLSLDQYTLTSSQHCSPGDALSIHKILKAERSMGIHWGTFCDTDEARGTLIEFGRERTRSEVGTDWEAPKETGAFVTTDIGQTLFVPSL